MSSPDRKPTLYLASPYGFADQWRRLCLPELVNALERLGIEVWEPFARNNQHSEADAAYDIGQSDRNDVCAADAIFAVVDGTPPDEGVAVELGIAIALNKPTFLFRDDFRRCTDSGEYPLNLMLFAGMPKHSWRDFYYTSVSELKLPNKALYRWAMGEFT